MPYHGMGSQLRGDPGLPVLGGLVGRGLWAVGKGLARKLAKPAVARAVGGVAAGGLIGRLGRRRPAIAPTIAGPGGIPLPGQWRMRPTAMLPFGKPGIVSEQKPAGHHWSEKAGRWVKNRRMNVVNPRALRRSIRRMAGFGKVVKRMRGAIGRAATAVGVRRGIRKARRR